MPIVMLQGACGRSAALLAGVRCAPAAKWVRSDGLDIGIVNNMPDAALEPTERQFLGLLAAAADKPQIRVRLFALPGVPRADAAGRYIAGNYADIGELWNGRLDGLIVTGTEPRQRALAQEPYWPAFTELVDWAAQTTTSTIWSCLAAHAAVWHIDRIDRSAFADKCFGVFQSRKIADHPMIRGVPAHFQVPHSRWNDLPEAALAECGYEILSHGDEIGADAFAKPFGSLFVFLQGHPEYEPSTLLREYRRDVGRFLHGERSDYPHQPRGYFDQTSTQALDAFRIGALASRDPALLESFPSVAVPEPLVDSWRASAVRFYRNWLSYLLARRRASSEPAAVSVPRKSKGRAKASLAKL
jgi:homoserine O-succinyltransferase/O-acetyltransferase